MQALALSRDDDRLRAISTKELRPVVVVGAVTEDLSWHYVTSMLMHPEGKDRAERTRPLHVHLERLNVAISALANQEPFIPTQQWRSRAQRRRYEGDAADSVISFQIAAETLLYATWRMLLVDEGVSAADLIDQMAQDRPFRSLLVRELPAKLGGNWDTNHVSTPVGRYWERLYLKRNRILHAGYQPHDGDAEDAEAAFVAFETFIEERLWARHKAFPRTLLAKLGTEMLAARGWMTQWMVEFCKQAELEPGFFYLPWDEAGR